METTHRDGGDQAANSPGPAVHALIVGIDAYPYAEPYHFRSLSSAVNSALSVHNWLSKSSSLLPAPLGTIRLLLSPTEQTSTQAQEIREIAQDAPRATLQNIFDAVAGWYHDANSHEENIAFFYWAGIGIQCFADDVALLLETFGSSVTNPFFDSVSFQNIYLGMASTVDRQRVANLQLYFVDAGRSLQGYTDIHPTRIFGLSRDILDVRIAPIYYAAVPGGESYGRPRGTTLFVEALVACLNGAAAEPTEDYDKGEIRWRVSVGSLSSGLKREMDRVHAEHSLPPALALSGLVADATICKLRKPPRSRALVVDHREVIAKTEGLHALVVGVSSYPFLPGGSARGPRHNAFPELKQLSSAANSAYRLFEWLQQHEDDLAAPIASIRLLISPSVRELEANPVLRDVGDRATLAKVLLAAAEWRQDLAFCRNGIGLFYFAGHGAQRQMGDSILMLEDVGDGVGGLLRNTVEVSNIFYGLAPNGSQRNIARKQLFLIDACRMRPMQFRRYEWMSTSQVFNVEQEGVDDRSAPILLATLPGSQAYGIAGDLSIFARALLESLNGAFTEDVADGKGVVSVSSLHHSLDMHIKRLNAEHKTAQKLAAGGQYGDFAITDRAKRATLGVTDV